MTRREILAALGGTLGALPLLGLRAAAHPEVEAPAHGNGAPTPTTGGVTTDDLMKTALDLAGYKDIPADSAVFNPGKGIRRVLFCLDADTGTLLYAHQMKYDCVLVHHPMNQLPGAGAVYARQVINMVRQGVPEAAAHEAVDGRVEELVFGGHTYNFDNLTAVAKRLGLAFLGIHNPLDELGRKRMQEVVDALLSRHGDATVGQVAEALAGQPEFRGLPVSVAVRSGDPHAPAKKVAVAHGAYTNGGYEVPATYFKNGVPTVVMIHIAWGDLQRLRREALGNLIITGHVGGDSMGFTPFLHALRARGLIVDTLGGVSGAEMSR